jgi:hypothetical protein
MRNEDDLRAALRSLESHAPDPAVVLRTAQERGGPPAQLNRDRRWRRAVAPLAAAASVVAVVAAVLVLTGPDGSRGQGPSTGQAAALASVPPYYVGLTGYRGGLGAHTHAEVRATATGKVLAAVSPPRPYRTFTWVSGAADDRTFVLAAQTRQQGVSAAQNSTQRTEFFLLRFNAATGAVALTALPVTEKPGDPVTGIALSPDGSKLAVVLASSQASQPPKTIQVIALATGATHDWTWTGAGSIGTQDFSGTQPLSWAAGSRTLAFQLWTGKQLSVHLLDTAASGSSLRSARQAVSIPTSNLDNGNSLLTPDGRTVVYAEAPARIDVPQVKAKLRFAEFSVRTGKLLRTLDPWWFSYTLGIIPYQQVLWTSSSGRTLIVISPPGTSPAGHWVRHPVAPVIGVLTGNHFTAIPGSPTASQNIEGVAW